MIDVFVDEPFQLPFIQANSKVASLPQDTKLPLKYYEIENKKGYCIIGCAKVLFNNLRISF